MSFLLPWGFNRGDGTTALPAFPIGSPDSGTFGTPADPDSVVTTASPQFLAGGDELPDSPTIERAEQATIMHRERMTWANGLAYITVLARGTIVEDSYGNIYRLLSSTLQSENGNTAILTTTCESVSFDNPPDDFQVNSVDLGVDLLKHPRYFYALFPNPSTDSIIQQQVKQAIIRAIQAYRDSPFYPTPGNLAMPSGTIQETIVQMVNLQKINYTIPNPAYQATIAATAILGPGVTAASAQNPQYLVAAYDNTANPDPVIGLALAAAGELIGKLWRMEDTPYLAGIELKWSQYWFLPPIFNLGSYLEDPTQIVPNYFMQPDRPLGELPPTAGGSWPVAGADNIFKLNGSINPQDFSANGQFGGATNISWLRKADEIDYQRTWFKITHTWIGSPVGYFDPQLYSAGNRPTNPSQYTTFS